MYRHKQPFFYCLFGAMLGVLLPAAHATDFKESLGIVSKTNLSAVESQKKIDSLSRETQGLLEEYRKLNDGNTYEAAYAQELEDLALAQQLQIEELKQQIASAKITRQRIVPLMRSMADALEKFVVLDLPFHHEQRLNSVVQLKHRLKQGDLSVSSRFRILLEAYQLEQSYGGTIEAWRGPLSYQGAELSVQFLRVGRVALYFQALDGKMGAYWSTAEADWIPLSSEYSKDMAQAMRVAKSQVAPQLLQLPLQISGGEL